MNATRRRQPGGPTIDDFVKATGRALERELPKFDAPRTALSAIENLGREKQRATTSQRAMRLGIEQLIERIESGTVAGATQTTFELREVLRDAAGR